MKFQSPHGATEPTRQRSANSIVWSSAFRRPGVDVNSEPRKRGTPNERGVALVITLIMLSVITFLTVAFLAVSQRDRVAVTNALNQTDSRLMADAAFARFQSEVVSRMMARGSLLNYDLMATRNYINPLGFNTGITVVDTNNVNYDVTTAGGLLGNNDHVRNIANLFYDPRVPVYVQTNVAGARDFRFYLDYNRNGRFETNGLLAVLDDAGVNTGVSNLFRGESEWIGVLQNPELPHGPNNKFIGRYLFLGLPISKTLDINHIHNYAKGNIGLSPAMPTDGFLRDQGAGSWELNLAAFLTDLNTNIYPNIGAPLSYEYFPDLSLGVNPNRGIAFEDALSLLSYRYTRNHGNLFSVANLFGGVGQTAMQNDFIDSYSSRPVLVSPFVNVTDPDATLTTQPWPGSNNKINYFTPQELFDIAKTSLNFNDRLNGLSSSNSTYNRYTFSRFLEQMGTGSEPEVKGKININYVNDPKLNVVPTNFVAWTPLQFFTNVAERLFRDNLVTHVLPSGVTNYYMFDTNNPANLVREGFSYTNIQIYPTNEYTAPVHRLLQLAANVYDATTTSRFPTVFRPQFEGRPGQTIITNFVAETNSVFVNVLTSTPIQERTNVTNPNGFVWGVPVIVGVKKGFPNFNKFVMQTAVQVSRNLQITKANTNPPPITFISTNQLLSLGVSNTFGLEAWNSYVSPYTNSFRILVTNVMTMAITNGATNGTGIIWPANGQTTNYGLFVNTNFPSWRSTLAGANAYYLPIGTKSLVLLTNEQFVGGNPAFIGNTNYLKNLGFPAPTWGVIMTNRLVYILIDTSEPLGRVIDFVNLADLTNTIDIIKELLGSDLTPPIQGVNSSTLAQIWNTNRAGVSPTLFTPTKGVEFQIQGSMDASRPKISETEWTSYSPSTPAGPQRERAVDNFLKFMGLSAIYNTRDQKMPPVTVMQTPFNPAHKFDHTSVWEINDPLVHYMAQDLRNSTNVSVLRVPPSNPPPDNFLKKLSVLYRPWGGNHPPGSIGQQSEGNLEYDLRVKDPRVRWSDDWDFPTNKFPSIGWLGRVHRGTPWQTVYLKAAAITNTDWFKWAGHYESHPTNDWKLLDVFSAAANDNAARGLLSVNQEGIASWSAALSGMIVLSNSIPDGQAKQFELLPPKFESVVIQPNSDFLKNLVAELNTLRTKKTNGVFESIGEILAAPSLSIAIDPTTGAITNSPFLNLANDSAQRKFGVTDEAYERIPQQLMSLLQLGEPRFVVYSYGQSLKPANNSLVLNPPVNTLFGLCTNYQITGEVVTRTVLRVEGTVQKPKVVIESYNILPAD